MDRLTQDLLTTETSAREEISPRRSHREELAEADARRLSSTTSYSQQRHFLTTGTGVHLSHLDPVELNRIYTYRLQHAATIGSRQSAAPREQWLPLGAGKPYPPSLPDAEEYLVEFTGPHDSLHPHNWPLITKYVTKIYVLN
jgi:DHA1 family multidrug resistance protein-like MFS transporter